ncbi:MAG TPA: acyl carrier protein [Nocardioides sp.]|nr:acyl carrier protein [Nocardioides sp.]
MTTDVPDGPADPLADQLADQLAEILAEALDIEPATVRPDQALADLGVDSLALIEVVIGVEQGLGVVIAEDDAARLTTVAELTSYVERRREQP